MSNALPAGSLSRIPFFRNFPPVCREDRGSYDDTEQIRRTMIATGQPQANLAAADKRWTTEELSAEFEVIGFMAPFVVARRKADGKMGSLQFTHHPRFYFGWKEDR